MFIDVYFLFAGMDLSLGHNHLRMKDVELLGANPNSGLYLYTNIERLGAAKTITVSGRLILANMLRHTLLFKVIFSFNLMCDFKKR